jgi:hypothetical protein
MNVHYDPNILTEEERVKGTELEWEVHIVYTALWKFKKTL